MNCEQFFFEGSYLLENGADRDCYEEAREHLRACAACRALVDRMGRKPAAMGPEDIPRISLPASQRLHRAIDAALGEAAKVPRTAPVLSWPGMAPASSGMMNAGVGTLQHGPAGSPWIGIAATCVILLGLVVALHFCPAAPSNSLTFIK